MYIAFLRSAFGLDDENPDLIDWILIGAVILFLVFFTTIQKGVIYPKEFVHAFQSVDTVLVKESDRKKVVSYHLKSDQYQQLERGSDGRLEITNVVDYFVQCNVITATIPYGGSDTFQNNPNTPAVRNNESKPSIKKRLQELENVKEFLSEKEYEKKKNGIIASI